MGKDTAELPSGYLVWILESYTDCDFNLREACKLELSERLSIDFTPAHPMDSDRIAQLQKELNSSETERAHFRDLICMAIICKGNPLIIEMYANNKPLMMQNLKIIREVNKQI